MIKYLALAVFCLVSVVSCAPQTPTRTISHIYQDGSKLGMVSIFDVSDGPQLVSNSFGQVQGTAKRSISKSDFELFWSRLHSENLSRFQIHDPSAKFETSNNIVVKFGTMPGDCPTYVVPKGSASPSLKATVAKIKKLAPL